MARFGKGRHLPQASQRSPAECSPAHGQLVSSVGTAATLTEMTKGSTTRCDNNGWEGG